MEVIIVSNVATVDVPGVMYLTRGDLVSMDCTLLGAKRIVYIGLLTVANIHIGVGSDVVCSTIIGNARASVCGMDNRTISRFFLCP